MPSVLRVALFAGTLAVGSWVGLGKPSVGQGQAWIEEAKASAKAKANAEADADANANANASANANANANARADASADANVQADEKAGKKVLPGTPEYERARIVAAMERASGNQKEAARILGMTRRMLMYRLDAYGLPRPRKR